MKIDSIKVKQIHYEQTYHIRQKVLRANRPIETCYFIGDEDKSNFHLGAFIEDEIIGVVSVFKSKNKIFNIETQFQIRGMAILEEYQKLGIGKKLITEAESILNKNYCIKKIIWFNARITAVEFYRKIGYNKIGDIFEITDVGKHQIMFKE